MAEEAGGKKKKDKKGGMASAVASTEKIRGWVFNFIVINFFID